MTDKEKILAEIKRLHEEASLNTERYECDDDVCNAQKWDEIAFIYRNLLDFINSLPQEPVSEGLEEAADDYADKHPTCGLAKNSFKAGAQWQKENGNH